MTAIQPLSCFYCHSDKKQPVSHDGKRFCSLHCFGQFTRERDKMRMLTYCVICHLQSSSKAFHITADSKEICSKKCFSKWLNDCGNKVAQKATSILANSKK